MGYSHRIQNYSAIKRNEVLIHAATWMNLANIKLSEKSQTQKATYYVIPFIRNVQNRKMFRDRKEVSGYQGLRGREMGNDC